MKALLKIEGFQTRRMWSVFILSVGMSLGFFLLYSGMDMGGSAAEQVSFIKRYMLTMTSFSISSFALFTFPYMLTQDRNDHYLTYIEHSPLGMSQYYTAKILRVIAYFTVSILVVFSAGAFMRNVSMTWDKWVMSVVLLLVTSLVFLALGLLLAQIKSEQVMSVVGNILFLGLAVIGGSWMPISLFPDWVQTISKYTPTYHVNRLVTDFAADGTFHGQSLLIVLAYAIIFAGLALTMKRKSEVH